jgi:hypothetical protein
MTGKIKNLIGQKFGILTVQCLADARRYGGAQWVCLCDCGQTRTVPAWDLKIAKMPSCGCLDGHHGHSYKSSRTYRSWVSMFSRCYNEKSNCYQNYGGRGITVCERWRYFRNFLADMGIRPDGKTLDRKKVNGNYEPRNCRWATPKEQSRNTRRSLTDRKVREIRVWLSDGFGPCTLGRKYDVSHSVISQIKHGQRWNDDAGEIGQTLSEG